MEPHDFNNALHCYCLNILIIDSNTIKDWLQNNIAFGHFEYVSRVFETMEHSLNAALECFGIILVAIDTVDDG